LTRLHKWLTGAEGVADRVVDWAHSAQWLIGTEGVADRVVDLGCAEIMMTMNQEDHLSKY
jgi:hypothetical protein